MGQRCLRHQHPASVTYVVTFTFLAYPLSRRDEIYSYTHALQVLPKLNCTYKTKGRVFRFKGWLYNLNVLRRPRIQHPSVRAVLWRQCRRSPSPLSSVGIKIS